MDDDGTIPRVGVRNTSLSFRSLAALETAERTSASSQPASTADVNNSAALSSSDALEVSFKCLRAVSRHCFKSSIRAGSSADCDVGHGGSFDFTINGERAREFRRGLGFSLPLLQGIVPPVH